MIGHNTYHLLNIKKEKFMSIHRNFFIALFGIMIVLSGAVVAIADWTTIQPGTIATFFGFSGPSGQQMPGMVPVDATGTPLHELGVGTAGNPASDVVTVQGPAGPIPVTISNSGTAIAAAATGTTSAVTASFAAGSDGKTNYICGFDISARGSTGNFTIGPVTLAGLIGGVTFSYTMTTSVLAPEISRYFNPCLPANAPNTAMTITTVADTSAISVDVNMWGYRQ